MHRIAIALTAIAVTAVLAGGAAAAKLSASDRKAISRTVDAFVLHAVRHENPAAVYGLVSPTFRAGLTRAEFAHKDPAYPYPARGKHFPWSLDYALPNEVGGSLLLQPEKRFVRKKGPILFDLIVLRRQGHWVVQSLIPKVIFGTPYQPKVRSVLDYSPQTARGRPDARPEPHQRLVHHLPLRDLRRVPGRSRGLGSTALAPESPDRLG